MPAQVDEGWTVLSEIRSLSETGKRGGLFAARVLTRCREVMDVLSGESRCRVESCSVDPYRIDDVE